MPQSVPKPARKQSGYPWMEPMRIAPKRLRRICKTVMRLEHCAFFIVATLLSDVDVIIVVL